MPGMSTKTHHEEVLEPQYRVLCKSFRERGHAGRVAKVSS